MQKLNASTLHQLDPVVAVPAYDRSKVGVGIVHFGVGGFHRAHQAMYVDQLMNDGKALDWGICGVGVMPADQRMKTVMDAQNGLYTLVIKHPDGSYKPRVIGSIIEYLYAPDDVKAVLEKMASPEVRIVSLTVTEGGYNFHHVTGAFNFDNPDVKHDLVEGAAPKTSFGLVTEALARRKSRGIAPFTVMSCDNIQGNGDVAKATFTAYARRKNAELGEWIAEHVKFPNSMVDRITPVTTDADRDEVRQRFGIDDAWPVVCEPFTQWVLEDHFNDGRPAFEDVGVQIVDEVMPYELMKLRLLNASHQALTYFGYLAGYRYAHEVCQDPLFVEFLLGYMVEEGSPTLSPLPGVDLDLYRRTLIERFANPPGHWTRARAEARDAHAAARSARDDAAARSDRAGDAAGLQRGRLFLALVVQLEIVAPALGRQLTGVQRHLNRAARLAAMAAIGETAGSASTSMSANRSRFSSPVSFSSRMPGVSIRQPPLGSCSSARCVVV
jgi:mannitol 2-dehydrogenase